MLVDELANVRIFKIGWRLLMAGLRGRSLADLWEGLARNNKQIFVDLKLPDIGNTVASVVHDFRDTPNVCFLTLHENMRWHDITLARNARGKSPTPKLLTVPFVSSLDAEDFPRIAPKTAARGVSLDEWILARADAALDHGCDGIIASGDAIQLCRQKWPREQHPDVLIVSPGIRPRGVATDDHKRFTTPAQAIRNGADYLVVGRPILNAKSRLVAAQNIIDEVDRALAEQEEESPSEVALAAVG